MKIRCLSLGLLWQQLHQILCLVLVWRWSWVILIAPSLWKAVQVLNARSFSPIHFTPIGINCATNLHPTVLPSPIVTFILHKLQGKISGSFAQGPQNLVLMVLSLVWGTEFNSPLGKKCRWASKAGSPVSPTEREALQSFSVPRVSQQALGIVLGTCQCSMGSTASLVPVLCALPSVSHSDALSITAEYVFKAVSQSL